MTCSIRCKYQDDEIRKKLNKLEQRVLRARRDLRNDPIQLKKYSHVN